MARPANPGELRLAKKARKARGPVGETARQRIAREAKERLEQQRREQGFQEENGSEQTPNINLQEQNPTLTPATNIIQRGIEQARQEQGRQRQQQTRDFLKQQLGQSTTTASNIVERGKTDVIEQNKLGTQPVFGVVMTSPEGRRRMIRAGERLEDFGRTSGEFVEQTQPEFLQPIAKAPATAARIAGGLLVKGGRQPRESTIEVALAAAGGTALGGARTLVAGSRVARTAFNVGVVGATGVTAIETARQGPEAIGEALPSAAVFGFAFGAASTPRNVLARDFQLSPTTTKPSPNPIRVVSVREGGATGDLLPSSFAASAPRFVAPSNRMVERGVPPEFTFETVGAKVQLQTRLAREGADPINTIPRTQEPFTGRARLEAAGTDPRQVPLSGSVELVKFDAAKPPSVSGQQQVFTGRKVLEFETRASNLRSLRGEVLDTPLPTVREQLFIKDKRGQITSIIPDRTFKNPLSTIQNPFSTSKGGLLPEASTRQPPPRLLGNEFRLGPLFVPRDTSSEFVTETISIPVQKRETESITEQEIDLDVTNVEVNTTPVQQPVIKSGSRSRQRSSTSQVQEFVSLQVPVTEQETNIVQTTQTARPKEDFFRQRTPARTGRPRPSGGLSISGLSEARGGGPLFEVTVGRKGRKVFAPLGVGGEEILRRGKSLAENTAAATVRVRQVSGQSVDLGGFFGNKFRAGKEQGEFIQRRETRISTSGEVRQISLEGVKASKKAKSLFDKEPFEFASKLQEKGLPLRNIRDKVKERFF